MSERNSTNGRMTTQFTVWCGRPDCAQWLQIDCESRREAGKLARHDGWDLTKAFGWRCPKCSQKARNAYAGR